MKITKQFIVTLFLFGIISCQKDTKTEPSETLTSNVGENFSSVEVFFAKNNVAMQTFTIKGGDGGTYISPQGTKLIIAPNAFISQSGSPILNEVVIQFKDIYKKSDMLLSNMVTMTTEGNLLKSGGEYYFKAFSNNTPVALLNGGKIAVNSPASLTGGFDPVNVMRPYVQDESSMTGWILNTSDSIKNLQNEYIFNLNAFLKGNIFGTGLWHNIDNLSFFNAYSTTTLTLRPIENPTVYNTRVFLMFKNISSVARIAKNGDNFTYNIAPKGIECTLVAAGIKDGVLYSSFVPLTISSNQVFNFSLSPTTSSEFLSQLKALN